MEDPASRSLLSVIKSRIFKQQAETSSVNSISNDHEIIHNLEDYFDTTIREVMVPRPKMMTIDKDVPIKNAIRLFHETGFSRLPVQEGRRDNIVGILYAIDLFGHIDTADSVLVSQVMRKATFISYSKKIHQVIYHFRSHQVQLAIVVDEHGGVDGLVTLEDVLEELVGEIPDELNKNDEPSYKPLGNGTVLMDANYPLSQFNELYNKDFQKEGIETIGGYVCHSAGKIPEKGEKIFLEDLRLVVDESNDRRLERLLISPIQ